MQHFRYFLMQINTGSWNEKETDMSAFLVIENEFDNFDNYDNYNLNLLFIKKIILRSRKQGSPHAPLMNSIPSRSIENSQER